MRRSTLTLVTTTSLALAALSSPLAADPWALISSVEIEEIETETEWLVKKSYPDGLEQGATLEVTGFLVPLLAQAYQSQFLIVPDPADCPFCGNGGYGPTLEVHVATPLPDLPEFSELTVTGRIELIDSTDTYQALRLVDADWALKGG